MAIMALRDFYCSLCGCVVTMMSGDLMYPRPVVCDQCLRDVWDLEDEALHQHVAGCLAKPIAAEVRKSPSRDPMVDEDSIVGHIQGYKERWSSAEKAVEAQELERDFWKGLAPGPSALEPDLQRSGGGRR